MIKAVIFDYGGVVKESHPLSTDVGKIFGLSEEELLKTEEERNRLVILASKGAISDEQLWQKISEIIGKPMPSNCLELVKNFRGRTLKFIPEITDLIKQLRVKKIKTAVLSNISRLGAEVIRENHGYDDFDEVILSYEVGMRKPEPEIYRLIIKKLGVDPKECIFIDDAEKNLLPAKDLGMITVLFKNPRQTVREVLNIIDLKKET